MKRESQLVERIGRALQAKIGARSRRDSSSSIALGIGDDAAVLNLSARNGWVVSCDAFVEDIHFHTKTHPADSVGYKALMRAASDLAAMGAIPRFYLLTLALPAARIGRWLDEFLAGMARASDELGIHAVGGDTTRSSIVSLSITVIGELKPELAVRRSGARPGDLIYVSGTLGRAQLGLALTLEGHARNPKLRALVAPHLYPSARIKLGSWLAQHKILSAMMDLSDGLSTDLARLCAASRVGAKLYEEKIPHVAIPPSATKYLRGKKMNPLEAALHGGDDYELLFTLPARRAAKLRRAPGFSAVRQIGEITRDKKIVLVDPAGNASPLRPLGWDSFR